MRVNQVKIGSVLSYVQIGLNVIINLLYTPAMLRILGQSEYGLYSTVASTISTLSILNLGFSSSYIKFYSRYKAEGDKKSEAILNGQFLLLFGFIGAVAFICGSFLIVNIHSIFSGGLSEGEYIIARVLMILLTINLSISFPMGVFSNIISAHEKYVFLKLVSLISMVVSPVVILPVLLLGYKSIGIVVATMALNVLVYIINIYYCTAKLRVNFIFDLHNIGLLKELFAFSIYIAINIIVDQINNNIDKILLARYRGTIETAIYSIGATFFGYYLMFSSSISSVFTPRIHRIVNENKENPQKEHDELTGLFVRVGRIQYILLLLIMTGIILFGREFISFWAGSEYGQSYYVALLLVIPATIPLCQNIGIEIQRAKSIHQFRSIIYFFMAIINLVSSVFLCQIFGAVGSAFGTCIATLIANILVMNLFYHKKCNIDIILFWKNIISISKACILPVFVAVMLNVFFQTGNVISLLIRIGFYSLIYFSSMWLLGLNSYEKSLIRKPLKLLLRKV